MLLWNKDGPSYVIHMSQTLQHVTNVEGITEWNIVQLG